YVGSLDSRTSTRVMEIPNLGGEGSSSVRYAAPGYLLFSRNRTLYAQLFDTKNLRISGDPVAIAENVFEFSASDNGTVVYRPHTRDSLPQEGPALLWLDRQ